jgi:hypothetical protein
MELGTRKEFGSRMARREFGSRMTRKGAKNAKGCSKAWFWFVAVVMFLIHGLIMSINTQQVFFSRLSRTFASFAFQVSFAFQRFFAPPNRSCGAGVNRGDQGHGTAPCAPTTPIIHSLKLDVHGRYFCNSSRTTRRTTSSSGSTRCDSIKARRAWLIIVW